MPPRIGSILPVRAVVTTLVVTSLVATTLSCSGSSESPTAPRTTPAANHDQPGRLRISPDSMLISQGDTVFISATLFDSHGSSSPAATAWTSSDSQIVTVGSGTGRLIAGAPGRAVITASTTNPSLQAQASVIVLPPPTTDPDGSLIVERFYMTEFQYPSAPNRWYYAPQIQVAAAPGRIAYVGLLTLSIPGLGGATPPFTCTAVITSPARDLNGEVYGDWAMSIDYNGAQANGSDATATIAYVDDSSVTRTMTVKGPIIPGGLPTTHGQDAGACFHGYGSSAP
jgi:hypothetical protein